MRLNDFLPRNDGATPCRLLKVINNENMYVVQFAFAALIVIHCGAVWSRNMPEHTNHIEIGTGK